LLLVELQLLLKQRIVVSTAPSRAWPTNNNWRATLLLPYCLVAPLLLLLLLRAAVVLLPLLQLVWVLLLAAVKFIQ
jgi:hypothetical protein